MVHVFHFIVLLAWGKVNFELNLGIGLGLDFVRNKTNQGGDIAKNTHKSVDRHGHFFVEGGFPKF